MKTSVEKVYWQAHRGGGAYERPDNTMAANLYAWSLGGIPEADIRTTRDGIIVCLHDETPARTTTAPDDVKDRLVSSFTFEEIRQWDAGVKFSESFKGERIPSLKEVFEEMSGRPERLFYLDLKEVDLQQLGALIDEYGVHEQVIFTHNVQDNCKRMKTIASGVRSMLWIGGNAERIQETFLQARQSEFDGLDQIQLHLKKSGQDGAVWPYALEPAFLEDALAAAQNAGLDLEVFPFEFEEASIHALLDIGIRWYATDEPAKFVQSVRSWMSN
ncbi:glycerophosphodiester phosphodiesterase family protein [Paenibacillus sp. FJAT-26967]|uniref:glycerophosphodiester phosphodiesterase n=1 Tax=Paenibacillus sp. FJAT-26967 TaxID=1729690 RepID=UPI00083936C5|nr:glycerophosphodiester phosphodiesterase family protein [Paenibacillus sp. FJAT-26967]